MSVSCLWPAARDKIGRARIAGPPHLCVKIPIDIQLDDKGYLDRRCPGDSCESEFKVFFDDWTDKVLDERVYCPICRHEAEATECRLMELVADPAANQSS